MLKTIAAFSTDIEAELIRGKLESAGIESFIFKDDCGGMRPHMQLTQGVQIKVADTDYDIAKDILSVPGVDKEDEPSGEMEVIKQIHHLLHRARGWILIGFAIIPGWVSFPISFVYSTMAHTQYKASGLDDDGIENKIVRVQFAAALFTVLFWSAAIYYASRFLGSLS